MSLFCLPFLWQDKNSAKKSQQLPWGNPLHSASSALTPNHCARCVGHLKTHFLTHSTRTGKGFSASCKKAKLKECHKAANRQPKHPADWWSLLSQSLSSHCLPNQWKDSFSYLSRRFLSLKAGSWRYEPLQDSTHFQNPFPAAVLPSDCSRLELQGAPKPQGRCLTLSQASDGSSAPRKEAKARDGTDR